MTMLSTSTTYAMNRTRERVHATKDQRGFGTLDVLLGMAIAALIITIGSVNIGKIQDRGQVSTSGQQAERMAQALESTVTDNYVAPTRGDGGTPTNAANHFPDWDGTGTVASVSNMTGLGVNLPTDTTIRFYRTVGAVEDGTYTFCSVVQRGSKYAWAYYDSRQREVRSSGMTSAMPTTAQCAP
jgi:type II secretory pathway pseudopilin PulG